MNAKSFWDTDLKDIEASFLPKDKKITDLPISRLDNRVPCQDGVLLGRVINIDHIIKKPSIFRAFKFWARARFPQLNKFFI